MITTARSAAAALLLCAAASPARAQPSAVETGARLDAPSADLRQPAAHLTLSWDGWHRAGRTHQGFGVAVTFDLPARPANAFRTWSVLAGVEGFASSGGPIFGCDVLLGATVEIGGRIRVRLEAWFAAFVAAASGRAEIWAAPLNTRALLVIGPVAAGLALGWTPDAPAGSMRLSGVLGINY